MEWMLDMVVRNGIRCRALVGCCLLLFATIARATDGVIEISQAGALAGDPATGDLPGFPLTLSSSGSYRLTSDLDLRVEPEPANTTAIEVLADFVWLDLNGFSIIGPFSCSGSPPRSAGSGDGIVALGHHVTVTGGHVRGIGRDAIALGDGGRVRDVVVTCSGRTGISVGAGGVVTKSRVDQSGDYGLDLGDGSAFGDNLLRDNDGGGASLQVTAGVQVVELQPNSCAGTTSCVVGGSVTRVVPVVCANNVTTDLTGIPFELTVGLDGPILGGAPFDAEIAATGQIPTWVLQAAVSTIPGLTEVSVTAFQATVTVRRGATGSDVVTTLTSPPQTVPIPLDGTGTVVTGPALVPLSTETGSYVADPSGAVLFEFAGAIPPTVIVTNPPGPTGIRVLAVVLQVGLECESGRLNDNGTPGDPTDDFSEPLPDSDVLAIPIH